MINHIAFFLPGTYFPAITFPKRKMILPLVVNTIIALLLTNPDVEVFSTLPVDTKGCKTSFIRFDKRLNDTQIGGDGFLIDESHNIYLSEEEIKRIYDLDVRDNSRMEQIRDLFIVGCYTGLRFSDLTQLNIESINQQKKVIKVKTQKTQELVIIPIKGMVATIIEKYKGHLPKLIDNQRMNYCLKELGVKAGINESFERVATKGGQRTREVFKKHELITVHTARRSFATNAYLQNVPSISIMKITGHRTERSFLKYIKISQEDNANKLINHPFFS